MQTKYAARNEDYGHVGRRENVDKRMMKRMVKRKKNMETEQGHKQCSL
jgi:hypothetical protein